jgi:hypothetical protein
VRSQAWSLVCEMSEPEERLAPPWQGHRAHRSPVGATRSKLAHHVPSSCRKRSAPSISRARHERPPRLRGEKETGWARAKSTREAHPHASGSLGDRADRGGWSRVRRGTCFSRRLLIRRDRHLACGGPARVDPTPSRNLSRSQKDDESSAWSNHTTASAASRHASMGWRYSRWSQQGCPAA